MIECQRGKWRPAAALAVAVLASGCGKPADRPWSAATPSVEALVVKAQPFVLASDLPGRIEPVRVATVRARVAGILLERRFDEGADVKAGDVLFRIDPAPFKAALSRAQGELAKAEAALFEALAVVRRYESLVKIDAVSQQDFDAAQATSRRAQATRQSAQADVETALLNLGYATVKAPISGRIGRALVTEGALVGQNEATMLATIQQLDPIYADFMQPVADVLRLRAALAGGLTPHGGKDAPISITVEGADKKRDGRMLFSDITVDRGTGQVSMRGQFANSDGLLLPGMYVRVHTGQGRDPQAILVPQRAVQHSADGKTQVLVVGQDDVAQARPVRTGTMRGSEWHILDGLKPGDRVIVGGVSAVRPGAKVSVAAPTAPGSATAQAPATTLRSASPSDARN